MNSFSPYYGLSGRAVLVVPYVQRPAELGLGDLTRTHDETIASK